MLIVERGMWVPDVVTRISSDGDEQSIKWIVNVFDKFHDPEITFTCTETPGNLCSGVKRSIVLCYVEGLKESYDVMRTLMEMLHLDDIPYLIASDFKLLNVLLGLCGHGGKFVCCYCEAPKGLIAGRVRTFGRMIECYQDYVKAGSPPKEMMKYYNVVNLPLIRMSMDQKVIDAVPPPELHCMMGVVNHLLELMRKFLYTQKKEGILWEWCNGKGITRRGKSLCQPVSQLVYKSVCQSAILVSGNIILDKLNSMYFRIQWKESSRWQ